MKICERCGQELQDNWAVCPFCTVSVPAPTATAPVPAKRGATWWKVVIVMLAVAAVALVGFAVYVALDDAGVFRTETPAPSGGMNLPSFVGDDTYAGLLGDELEEDFGIHEEADGNDILDDEWLEDSEVVDYTEEELALLDRYVEAGSFDGNVYVNTELGWRFTCGALFPEDVGFAEGYNSYAGELCLYTGLANEPYNEMMLTVDIAWDTPETMLAEELEESRDWYEESGMTARVLRNATANLGGTQFVTCTMEVTSDVYTEYAYAAVGTQDDVVVILWIWSDSLETIEEGIAGIAPLSHALETGTAGAA